MSEELKLRLAVFQRGLALTHTEIEKSDIAQARYYFDGCVTLLEAIEKELQTNESLSNNGL